MLLRRSTRQRRPPVTFATTNFSGKQLTTSPTKSTSETPTKWWTENKHLYSELLLPVYNPNPYQGPSDYAEDSTPTPFQATTWTEDAGSDYDEYDYDYDPVNNTVYNDPAILLPIPECSPMAPPTSCFNATTMDIERDARTLSSLPAPSRRHNSTTPTTIATPAFLDTSGGALDVNGRVPKEAIIDSGASKTMLSSNYAVTVGVNLANLEEGEGFITASGSIERPMGMAWVDFTLMRGTEHEHRVTIKVTIVDTLVYDTLLGVDFIRAVKGAYDTWTETFRYRWVDTFGGFHSHEISAPCHTKIPQPIGVAYYTDNEDYIRRAAAKRETTSTTKLKGLQDSTTRENYNYTDKTRPRTQDQYKFSWHVQTESGSATQEGEIKEGGYYTSSDGEGSVRKTTMRTRSERRGGHTLKTTKSKQFIRRWILDNDTTEWLEEFLEQQNK